MIACVNVNIFAELNRTELMFVYQVHDGRRVMVTDIIQIRDRMRRMCRVQYSIQAVTKLAARGDRPADDSDTCEPHVAAVCVVVPWERRGHRSRVSAPVSRYLHQ